MPQSVIKRFCHFLKRFCREFQLRFRPLGARTSTEVSSPVRFQVSPALPGLRLRVQLSNITSPCLYLRPSAVLEHGISVFSLLPMASRNPHKVGTLSDVRSKGRVATCTTPPLSGTKLKRKTDLNSEGKTRKTTPVKRTH